MNTQDSNVNLSSPTADWLPTSILPAERRVVELRSHRFPDCVRGQFRDFMLWVGYEHDSPVKFSKSAHPNEYKWRYPPGERAEATPLCNCGADKFAMQVASAHLQRCPMFNAAGQAPCKGRPYGSGPEVSDSSKVPPTGLGTPSAKDSFVQPVPAAPRRQNLDMWLWIRNRGPAPESKREPLKPLLASAFRVWK